MDKIHCVSEIIFSFSGPRQQIADELRYLKTRLKPKFTLVVRIGDFLFLAYVNEYILNEIKYGTNIRLLLQRYRIHSITSARRSHPDSYDKCEPGFYV